MQHANVVQYVTLLSLYSITPTAAAPKTRHQCQSAYFTKFTVILA